MTIRFLTVLPMLTVLALAAGSAAASAPGEYQVANIRTEQLNNKYRENMKHTTGLETALRRFEREIAGKRGRSAARSSKPREIVVVGSKVKDVVRSPRAGGGGFSDVSGLSTEVDAVEYRSGGPASLPQLQGAIRRFEQAAGPRNKCVGSCKASARRCLARCRGTLRRNGIKGRCICDHLQARCLLAQARQGKCHPPDPGRVRRGLKRPGGR